MSEKFVWKEWKLFPGTTSRKSISHGHFKVQIDTNYGTFNRKKTKLKIQSGGTRYTHLVRSNKIFL